MRQEFPLPKYTELDMMDALMNFSAPEWSEAESNYDAALRHIVLLGKQPILLQDSNQVDATSYSLGLSVGIVLYANYIRKQEIARLEAIANG